MIVQPYINFIQPDAGGNVKPVSKGKVYIGKEGLDQKSGGVPIYYKDNQGVEKEITNPIHLNMTGVPVAGLNDSTIINPYTKEPISILIEDRNGNPVYSEMIGVSRYTDEGRVNQLIQDKVTLTFSSIGDLKAGTTHGGEPVTLKNGDSVRWLGYNSQSDGGSNWGIVRAGAHVEDGGSIFSINSNLYVEANLKGFSISVAKFGALPNSGVDEWDRIWKAMNYAASNPSKLTFSAGEYLHSDEFNLGTLPRDTIDNDDPRSSLHFEGVKDKTILRGMTGCARGIFQDKNAAYRTVTLHNFKFRHQDPFDDLTQRADYIAVQLLSNPGSDYKNLDFLGLRAGLHAGSVFMSSFKNIKTNRCRQGVWIDGRADDVPVGLASFVNMKNITCGGYANDWGLRLTGVFSSTVNNFDTEAGYAGRGLVIESCSGVKINGIYLESYASVAPVYIGVYPFNAPAQTSIDDYRLWSKDIEINGGWAQGLSIGRIADLSKGVDNIKFANISQAETSTTDNTVTDVVRLTGGGFTSQGGLRTIRGIDISGMNSGWQDDLSVADPYSEIFVQGHNLIQKQSNRGYYGLTIKRGFTYYNEALSTNNIVTEAGTFGATLTATVTTVAGSRTIQCSDVTGIDAGSYMIIDGTDKVFVERVNRTTKEIVLLSAHLTTKTGVSIQYKPPVFV